MTEGAIKRVEPREFTENFASILSNKIIATDVVLKVKLHKGLEFRNEESKDLSSEETILTKNLGNVT